MAIKVNGISFNVEELKKVQLSDVKTQTISRAHFFHRLPGDNLLSLLRAGDFVEPSFISHYLEKGMTSLHQLEIIDNEDLVSYQKAWKDLKQTSTELDLFKQRDLLLEKIAKDFWNSDQKSFLSFALAAFEEFYIYPPHILDHLQAESSVLYTRALLTSSLVTITALVNGYLDYNFIKDLYNTAFIMDYGLVDFGNFNYVMSLACEAERKTPGTGLDLLKKYKRPEGEWEVFKNHAHISYERAYEQKEHFTYPEITNFIKYHHEKTDGSGFPEGYSYSAMSDAETLLIFVDYLVPFEEHVFNLGDGSLIVKKYFENLKIMDNAHLLPIRKLINSWEASMNWVLKKDVA